MLYFIDFAQLSLHEGKDFPDYTFDKRANGDDGEHLKGDKINAGNGVFVENIAEVVNEFGPRAED